MPKFKTAYLNKPVQQSITFMGDSMTENSHKAECDINNIMAKYQKTGIIEHGQIKTPEYGDFDSLDYHQSMNLISEANEHFKTLPSTLRKRFKNSPSKYLEFMEDSKNRAEAVKLGLIESSKTRQDHIKGGHTRRNTDDPIAMSIPPVENP